MIPIVCLRLLRCVLSNVNVNAGCHRRQLNLGLSTWKTSLDDETASLSLRSIQGRNSNFIIHF